MYAYILADNRGFVNTWMYVWRPINQGQALCWAGGRWRHPCLPLGEIGLWETA